ncbi:Cyclin-D3-1 [Vitis vinifera]|uniref:Cyclin-D3-1 n=1 Tax=Vitis vinifera TaxID=29760 RepID=A0A438KRD4_VITVI|nr:Cyclin-D3-1 [Vitis vinifera]
MALQEQETLSQNAPFFLDGLYCEEERFGDDDDGEVEEASEIEKCDREKKQSLFPLTLLEHDLFWEDDELCSLISKEEQAHHCYSGIISDGFLTVARTKAVEWMLKVNAHYGFSALTAVLAVNYFDRFLSSSCFQRDKPWMSQLAAVTCLSLAAKVDETDVPLLLDLQVEETKYVFEAKTIQRMELLTHLHWEFLERCERLLLSVIADSRFLCYLPSTLATATMLHIITEVEPCNPLEYQNQLLSVLKISKNDVDDCYKLILEFWVAMGIPKTRPTSASICPCPAAQVASLMRPLAVIAPVIHGLWRHQFHHLPSLFSKRAEPRTSRCDFLH